MRTIGICIGASTVSAVELIKKENLYEQIAQTTIFHDGDSKKGFIDVLKTFNPQKEDKIVVTGRKFKNFINLSTITEPEAIENAVSVLIKNKASHNALVSAGGETILVYQLNNEGKIHNVFTGNKCASGTGSFFLQQLGRMALTIDGVIDKEFESEKVYPISGRCSVFCKSDCTHALIKV